MTTIDDFIGYGDRLGTHPSGRTRIRLTADDWQLFTAAMDCREAASALNVAAQNALREPTRDAARAAFMGIAREWAAYGACDTEPRTVLSRILDHYWGTGR